jgi:hypothetical protein
MQGEASIVTAKQIGRAFTCCILQRTARTSQSTVGTSSIAANSQASVEVRDQLSLVGSYKLKRGVAASFDQCQKECSKSLLYPLVPPSAAPVCPTASTTDSQ